MKAQILSIGTAAIVAATAIAATVASVAPTARAGDCPDGGTVRFGVEPYDTATRLVPIYQKIGKLIGENDFERYGVMVRDG